MNFAGAKLPHYETLRGEKPADIETAVILPESVFKAPEGKREFWAWGWKFLYWKKKKNWLIQFLFGNTTSSFLWGTSDREALTQKHIIYNTLTIGQNTQDWAD